MTHKSIFSMVALMGLIATPAVAVASGSTQHNGIKVWKPYVIEKNCTDGRYKCQVRMDYAPFQNSMEVRPGSYWYQKPFLHYSYGDFGTQDSHEQNHQLSHENRSSPNY